MSEYLRDVSEVFVATQAEVFSLGSANAEKSPAGSPPRWKTVPVVGVRWSDGFL